MVVYLPETTLLPRKANEVLLHQTHTLGKAVASIRVNSEVAELVLEVHTVANLVDTEAEKVQNRERRATKELRHARMDGSPGRHRCLQEASKWSPWR